MKQVLVAVTLVSYCRVTKLSLAACVPAFADATGSGDQDLTPDSTTGKAKQGFPIKLNAASQGVPDGEASFKTAPTNEGFLVKHDIFSPGGSTNEVNISSRRDPGIESSVATPRPFSQLVSTSYSVQLPAGYGSKSGIIDKGDNKTTKLVSEVDQRLVNSNTGDRSNPIRKLGVLGQDVLVKGGYNATFGSSGSSADGFNRPRQAHGGYDVSGGSQGYTIIRGGHRVGGREAHSLTARGHNRPGFVIGSHGILFGGNKSAGFTTIRGGHGFRGHASPGFTNRGHGVAEATYRAGSFNGNSPVLLGGSSDRVGLAVGSTSRYGNVYQNGLWFRGFKPEEQEYIGSGDSAHRYHSISGSHKLKGYNCGRGSRSCDGQHYLYSYGR